MAKSRTLPTSSPAKTIGLSATSKPAPAILPSDGPWLRYAAGDPMLGIVNAYRGAQVKLVDFDLWYTIPVGDEAERTASQEWHRDPEDQHVVKVFLYFSDVDEDAGPFEYVKHSAEGFEYGHLWPWGEGEIALNERQSLIG